MLRFKTQIVQVLIFGMIMGMTMAINLENAFSEDQKSGSRNKVIDFEGDLVEGVNKRPLDSLSELSERKKKRKKEHLYRKRKGFKSEVHKTVQELRYLE